MTIPVDTNMTKMKDGGSGHSFRQSGHFYSMAVPLLSVTSI